MDDVPIGFKKSVSPENPENIEGQELDGYQRWITHGMLMAPVNEEGGDAKLQLHDGGA